MNKRKQISIGAILSYIQIAVASLITFLYTPFLIRILGQSEYGLYNTVSSTISSLSILSLGFGSSYIKFFTSYKNTASSNSIEILNGMFMTIFLVLGSLAFSCGLYLSNNLHFVFADGLNIDEISTAKILMVILTINLAISFPSSVFTSIITAHEQFIFQKSLMIIRQILIPILCIPLLLNGFASIGIVTATFIVNIIIDVSNVIFCIFKLHTKFLFGVFDFKVFRDMFVYTSFIAINMIVDQINLNIDKLLLGRYVGTIGVAIYSAAFTIYHYYTSFSTSISNIFIPRVHYIWTSDQSVSIKNHELSKLFSLVGRFQFYIMWLLCTGLLLFGRQFILFWAGSGYEKSHIIVILLSFSAVIPLTQNLGIEIQRAKNKHKYRAILYLFMAFLNLLVSIPLCKKFGGIGCAFGTALSFIIANTILMNIYYYKSLNIDISLYWSKILKIVSSSFISILFGFIYCRIANTYLILPLIFGIVSYTILYCFCEYIWTFSFSEKKIIYTKIKSIIR